jgi:hypothetical protein
MEKCSVSEPPVSSIPRRFFRIADHHAADSCAGLRVAAARGNFAIAIGGVAGENSDGPKSAVVS